MPTQGICSFAGVGATRGWELTFTPGITPSTCVMTTLESLSFGIPRTGTLVLEQDGNTISFPNCRVASRNITSGRNGTYVKLAIQDRRWRWQFSQIDGSYNIRKSKDVILRKKTPQELAGLLFEAMGEPDADVTQLPNGSEENPVLPEADWQGVAAAPILSQLCSSLGCFVYLDAGTNTAKIARVGEGLDLPAGGRIMQKAQPTVVAAHPDEVRYVTGPSLFQTNFELEAVGFDTDDTIKLLDDLSYKPEVGWENVDPYGFYSVKGNYEYQGETIERRSLAKAVVWRMYRVKQVAGNTATKKFQLKSLEDTDFDPTKLQDILPLRQTKVDTFTDPEGEIKEWPYTIQGSFAWPEQMAVFTGEDNAEIKVMPDDWSRLDAKAAIVYFNLPVFFWGVGNAVRPAFISLTTSFTVNIEGVKVRHEEFRPLVQPGEELGTGPFLIARVDTQRKIVESQGQVADDNAEDIKLEADYYIDQWRRDLQSSNAQNRTYSRILQWSIDGKTLQVTWSGGGGNPATTTISQGSEHNPYVPGYKKKSEQVETKRIAEKAAFEQGYNREVFER